MKVFVLGGVPVTAQSAQFAEQRSLLLAQARQIGQQLVAAGNKLVLCSPFEDSADFASLQGVADCDALEAVPTVEMYFPDTAEVRQRIQKLADELPVTIVPSPQAPPEGESKEAWQFAWLLCQLRASEEANVTIAIGGRANGSARLLLLLAEGRRSFVLPITTLGGAAAHSFDRQRYLLEDCLGSKIGALGDQARLAEIPNMLHALCEKGTAETIGNKAERRFFISYAKSRPAEADLVETMLRRRHAVVVRDESCFGAGHSIPEAIRRAIYEASVFVALWCREYACSPWCFDELELALDRRGENRIEMWILCLDETRIVPPRARELVHYDVRTREELEGTLLRLLTS